MSKINIITLIALITSTVVIAQDNNTVVINPPSSREITAETDSILDIELLMFLRGDVYYGGIPLYKTEVQQLMENSDALIYYNKGMKKINNALWWQSIGGGTVLLGSTVGLVGVLSGQSTKHKGYLDIFQASVICGGTAFIIGTIIKFPGKKDVKTAVKIYNNELINNSSLELKVGFTEKGVGLLVSF